MQKTTAHIDWGACFGPAMFAMGSSTNMTAQQQVRLFAQLADIKKPLHAADQWAL